MLSRALRIRFAYIEVSVIIVPALVLGSVGIKRNRKKYGQIRKVSNHDGHCLAMVVCHRKHLFHSSCGLTLICIQSVSNSAWVIHA